MLVLMVTHRVSQDSMICLNECIENVLTYDEYAKKDPFYLSAYVLRTRFDVPHQYRLEQPVGNVLALVRGLMCWYV
jgi:hypothetical protein